MTEPDRSTFSSLSASLADSVAAAAPVIAGIHQGGRVRAAILWRDGVVVTSEQALADDDAYQLVLPGGGKAAGALAGRDPTTNVAVLRVEAARGSEPAAAASARAGGLVITLGSDGAGGATARLAMLHTVGPAWDSMAGGRIDALLRLDVRAGRAEEGGPVIDASGGLLGMATAGPRGRALVIPHATIARALGPLLAGKTPSRGWLGLGLQPVVLPDAMRVAAGQESGLLVVSMAKGGPAERSGVIPGDILLSVGGHDVSHPRALRSALGAETVGTLTELRLLRAGAPLSLTATVAARPAA